jgi:hypothetical protein
MRGLYLRSKKAIAPVGEQGWLTPIAACAGDATHWRFRCRCNAECVKRAKDVRKAVAAGRTPKCSPKCQGRAAA